MSAGWDIIAMEILRGSLSTVVNLLKVLIPLMIIIELLMTYKVIEKLAVKLEILGKVMGMKKEAVFPLLVGIVMGVTYGAGTLIEINKKTPLSKRDFMLIGVFMYMCHGIIETGLLFGVAGASVIVVTLVRLLLAFVVTVILSKTPYFRNMDGSTPDSPKLAGEDMAETEIKSDAAGSVMKNDDEVSAEEMADMGLKSHTDKADMDLENVAHKK